MVVAIWGLEWAYGAMRGDTDIIAAMATLAYDGRRRDFFEEQLIAALQIIEAGDVGPRQMTGSWAGAMGHTQFMAQFLPRATRSTSTATGGATSGSGRSGQMRWPPPPTTCATKAGPRGQPWGKVEVTLPQGFDFSLTGERGPKRGAAFWHGQGVRLAVGGRVAGSWRGLDPAAAGPSRRRALMIFANFHVIERYNPADAYVIAVGHPVRPDHRRRPVSAAPGRARIAPSAATSGRDCSAASWRPASTANNVDGIIGPQTIDSVRRFQASVGLGADGYASLRVLEQLR